MGWVLSGLNAMPFRTIDRDDPQDKNRYDRMIHLVRQRLDFHRRRRATKTAQSRTIIDRYIEVTDKQINALVYELYGLTKDEIALVEGDTLVPHGESP